MTIADLQSSDYEGDGVKERIMKQHEEFIGGERGPLIMKQKHGSRWHTPERERGREILLSQMLVTKEDRQVEKQDER